MAGRRAVNKDNNKRGVWRLTINKSQTEFENFRQVLKEILFLKYIHKPPPSLEKWSHRITVKSGIWISQSFIPSNKNVSQRPKNKVERLHKSCKSLNFGFDFVNNLAIFNSIKLYMGVWT